MESFLTAQGAKLRNFETSNFRNILTGWCSLPLTIVEKTFAKNQLGSGKWSSRHPRSAGFMPAPDSESDLWNQELRSSSPGACELRRRINRTVDASEISSEMFGIFFFVARKSLRKREKQIVWFFKKDKSFLFNSKKSPLLNKSRYIQVKNLGVFFIPQFFEGLGIPYVPCEWNIYRSMNGLNLWSWYINVAKHEPVPWSFERYVM